MTNLLVFAQEQPPPIQPTPAPNFDVHIDLSGLADLIWQSFVYHIGDLGTAIWTPLSVWLVVGLRSAAQAIWSATFGAVFNILGQVPPEWTYDNPAYRAIATNPVPIAVGGPTLALVLLGLRTLLGSMVGRDHVITHVTGRLIPAVFLTLAYPVLVVQAIGLLNQASGQIGTQAAAAALLEFPAAPAVALTIPYMFLWVVLIYYAVRLLLRLAYSIFRLVVALVFGPVALILWAIPQTEWITWFWLREVLAWSTTPLLVTVCLAVAIPLASGRSGFLAAAVFGIAGFQAATTWSGCSAWHTAAAEA